MTSQIFISCLVALAFKSMPEREVRNPRFVPHADTVTFADMTDCVDKGYIPESVYVKIALKLIRRYGDSMELNMIYHPYPSYSETDTLAKLRTTYINRSINDSLGTDKHWCRLETERFINDCVVIKGTYSSVMDKFRQLGIDSNEVWFRCIQTKAFAQSKTYCTITRDSASHYQGMLLAYTICSLGQRLVNRRVDYIMNWKFDVKHTCQNMKQ